MGRDGGAHGVGQSTGGAGVGIEKHLDTFLARVQVAGVGVPHFLAIAHAFGAQMDEGAADHKQIAGDQFAEVSVAV